ncbi:MAG: hypothetical protein PHV82_12100 [Victivallaceae bacterium]|nr:hypothetical protein [Victivallaceae bacterium]
MPGDESLHSKAIYNASLSLPIKPRVCSRAGFFFPLSMKFVTTDAFVQNLSVKFPSIIGDSDIKGHVTSGIVNFVIFAEVFWGRSAFLEEMANGVGREPFSS